MPPAYRRGFANIGLDGYVWQLGRLGSRGHCSSSSYLFPAGLRERLIAKPCYLGSAFRAATLNEHAPVTHAQRVAGRELRRPAAMAERVGEQQLADMLGGSFSAPATPRSR